MEETGQRRRWMPRVQSDYTIARRLSTCLSENTEKDSLGEVTGDGKWIYCENSKREKGHQ